MTRASKGYLRLALSKQCVKAGNSRRAKLWAGKGKQARVWNMFHEQIDTDPSKVPEMPSSPYLPSEVNLRVQPCTVWRSRAFLLRSMWALSQKSQPPHKCFTQSTMLDDIHKRQTEFPFLAELLSVQSTSCPHQPHPSSDVHLGSRMLAYQQTNQWWAGSAPMKMISLLFTPHLSALCSCNTKPYSSVLSLFFLSHSHPNPHFQKRNLSASKFGLALTHTWTSEVTVESQENWHTIN